MDSNNDTYVDPHQPTRDGPDDPLMNGNAKRNHPVSNQYVYKHNQSSFFFLFWFDF